MIKYDIEALEYISKLSEGGLRDAITMLDKCLSYNTDLTLENVVKALGTVDYEQMKQLTDGVLSQYALQCIDVIEEVHRSGKDMKQFINLYTQFLLDIQKYRLTASGDYIQIPATDENLNWLEKLQDEDYEVCLDLLNSMVKLNSAVKWSQTPKYDLEAELLLFAMEDGE